MFHLGSMEAALAIRGAIVDQSDPKSILEVSMRFVHSDEIL